jgi:hypothetical protein
MTLTSDSITSRSVASGDTEPSRKTEGLLWRDDSGDNVELHQWTGSSWETWFAKGPDTPEYPVEGTLWNPGDGTTQRYSGSQFDQLGVNDHSDLTGLTGYDHPQYGTHLEAAFRRQAAKNSNVEWNNAAQNYNDVTGSKTKGTWYQNDKNTAIAWRFTEGGDDTAYLAVEPTQSENPNWNVAQGGTEELIVPPGWYYKHTEDNPNSPSSLGKWEELAL